MLTTVLTSALRHAQTLVKSEKTADIPVFTDTGACVQEDLEWFKIGLDSKFEVNIDRYAILKSRIHDAFVRTTDCAASIVLDEISRERYDNWKDLVKELELTLRDINLEYITSCRLFNLRQIYRAFKDFYPEIKLVVRRISYKRAGLKQLLRYALLKKLTERLASVDV